MSQAKMESHKARITSRDLKVLRSLFENCVMSFEQIHKSCFTGLAAVTAYNRIKELTDAGFVESFKVGSVVYQNTPRLIGNIYRVSRRGIFELKKCFGIEAIGRDDPFQWNTSQLWHDLSLNDLGTVLSKYATDFEFVNGKHLVESQHIKQRIPDAILKFPKQKEHLAIELELTMKSEKRYREILLSYRFSHATVRILYVSIDKGILQKIQSILTNQRINKDKLNRTIGKFHFATMQELHSENALAIVKSCLPETINPIEVRL